MRSLTWEMWEGDCRGAGDREEDGGMRERKKSRWTLRFLERGIWPTNDIGNHGKVGKSNVYGLGHAAGLHFGTCMKKCLSGIGACILSHTQHGNKIKYRRVPKTAISTTH